MPLHPDLDRPPPLPPLTIPTWLNTIILGPAVATATAYACHLQFISAAFCLLVFALLNQGQRLLQQPGAAQVQFGLIAYGFLVAVLGWLTTLASAGALGWSVRTAGRLAALYVLLFVICYIGWAVLHRLRD